MNMFKPVKAKSVKEYFDMLPPERREPIEFCISSSKKPLLL